MGSRSITISSLAALTLCWSQLGPVPAASAQAVKQAAYTAPTTSDYSQRVVAYIYETIPITREELGEYLIARMGEERIKNLVNKRIIEHQCKLKGIEVTQAEVDADLVETLKGLGPNINLADFEKKILKPYNKTLYEWKEDVIKPRLMLTKLCRDRVKVTDQDLKEAFEAYHGAKVECQIIMWPTDQKNIAMAIYNKIRESSEEFDKAASRQANPKLASTWGKIAPFGKHTTGNEEMEKQAFRLQPGEISQVFETKEGCVVLKCLKHLPADSTKTIEGEREALSKDIINRKISQVEIPNYFHEIEAQAKAKILLRSKITEEELVREVREELSEANKDKEKLKGSEKK